MLKTSIIIVLALFTKISYSQLGGTDQIKDSLKHQLNIARDDTSRVIAMARLATGYWTSSFDSLIMYGNQALSLAQRIPYPRGESSALNALGVGILLVGNYPKSFEYLYRSLQIAENKYPIETAACYQWIGLAYWYLADYSKSVDFYKKSKALFESLSSTSEIRDYILLANLAIGQSYVDWNQLDSANFYLTEYYNAKLHDPYMHAVVAELLGDCKFKQGDHEMGFKYVRESIPETLVNGDYVTQAEAYAVISKFFDSTLNLDSAIYYGKLGLNSAYEMPYKAGIYKNSKLLALEYEPLSAQMALHYRKIYDSINEEMYGAKKVQQLQKTLAEEQHRQQQILQEQIEKENQEKLRQQQAEQKQIEKENQEKLRQQQAEQKQIEKENQEKLRQQQAEQKQIEKENQEKLRQQRAEQKQIEKENRNRQYSFISGLAVLLLIASILYRNNLQKKKANVLLINEKDKVESTLKELKSTQAQLIQSEKMASLGEMTAGIAHEIQNPLNFVNNFSEVNGDLIKELKGEAAKGNIGEVTAIANEIETNSEKINHHGKRADAIVKEMLQHSRSSSGQKELVDINAMVDEYLRLSYQGQRAKDKDFNARIITILDPNIGKISIIPQDISRVLLNFYNNAFYAVNERRQQSPNGYEPDISVITKKVKEGIQISIKDNGIGIPENIRQKIFQPFFTTKPTGQGTGLGLSLAYDIIKAHGGEIRVGSKEGEGSEFIIQLPGAW